MGDKGKEVVKPHFRNKNKSFVDLVQVEHGDAGHLPGGAAGPSRGLEVHLEEVGVRGLGYHSFNKCYTPS